MTIPSESFFHVPAWRLFTLRRTDTVRELTVQAHDYGVEGTAAGWLVEFYEYVERYTDDDEQVLVGHAIRSYAIPADVTFDVSVEDETLGSAGRAH